MLNYFRINDTSRLITIALLMLVIRIPFFLWGDILSEEDLRLMLLGEKVASGNWLYLDIYTYEAPFSGLFFGFVDLIFGKSAFAYQLIGYLFAVAQVYLFNRLITDNRATLSQTYYAGLVYGILLSLFPAAYSVSPSLIAVTFLLLAINYQFNHLEFKVKRDEKILSIGFFISTASLFVSSGSIFLLTALVVFMLFSNTVLRRYFILLAGFFLPYMLLGGLYILKGSQSVFIDSLSMGFDSSIHLEPWFYLMLLIPGLALLRSLTFSLFGRRFTNYQSTLNQAMLFWFVSSVAVIWLGKGEPSRLFIFTIPLLSMYISHMLVSMRSMFLPLGFFLLFGGIVYASVLEWMRPDYILPYFGERKEINSIHSQYTKDRSILLLGDGFAEYAPGRHASPFFDWELNEEYFNSSTTHEAVTLIRRGIVEGKPEVIIDSNGLLSPYIEKIQELEGKYSKRGDLYILK